MHFPFKSISYKLAVGIAVSTIIPLLIFCFFFYDYMCNSYHKKYIDQAESSMSVSIQNINHYISTCITSAQSVYYNSDIQDLLLYGNHQDFMTIESNQSKQVISYMLSVYAATPDAVQIRLAAYHLNKSFLVTTKNLQRYIKTVDYSNEKFLPNGSFNQANVESIHIMHSYNHFTTYNIQNTQKEKNNPQYVFTIHLPIYILPSSKDVMGMLSIDIPISFIENNCKYVSYKGEQNYVVDMDNNIIFSADSEQIGKKIQAGSTLDVFDSEYFQNSMLNIQNSSSLLVLSKGFDSALFQWLIVKTVPTEVIYKDIRIQLIMLLFYLVICLVAAVLFNSISVFHYTTPLKKATDYIVDINNSTDGFMDAKLSDYVSYKKNDEIGILLASLENMLYSIKNYMIKQYELDIVNKTTELEMLQAQINPHFIYNTLQCLATRSLKNNDRDQYDYISSLGQMMQYSMETKKPLIHLKDELSHADRYINLQKIRFINNLNVIWEISHETKDIIVPKMILQPLIENSLKHGNLFKSGNGLIVIRSLTIENFLYIYVIDNGCPVSEEQRNKLHQDFNTLRTKYNTNNIDFYSYQQNIKSHDVRSIPDYNNNAGKGKKHLRYTSNIGLSNVFIRLLLNFGADCNIDIYSNEKNGTTVQLTISYKSFWPHDTHIK